MGKFEKRLEEHFRKSTRVAKLAKEKFLERLDFKGAQRQSREWNHWFEQESGDFVIEVFHSIYAALQDCDETEETYSEADFQLVEDWLWIVLPQCAKCDHPEVFSSLVEEPEMHIAGTGGAEPLVELVGTVLWFRIELLNAYLDRRKAYLRLDVRNGLRRPMPQWGLYHAPENARDEEQAAWDLRQQAYLTIPEAEADKDLFKERWNNDPEFRSGVISELEYRKSSRPGAERITPYYIVTDEEASRRVAEALSEMRSLVRINILPKGSPNLPKSERSERMLTELLSWIRDRRSKSPEHGNTKDQRP